MQIPSPNPPREYASAPPPPGSTPPLLQTSYGSLSRGERCYMVRSGSGRERAWAERRNAGREGGQLTNAIPRAAVPGSSVRMLEKSLSSGADSLAYDLEDSVAPEMKPTARRQVASFLNVGPSAQAYPVPLLSTMRMDRGIALHQASERSGSTPLGLDSRRTIWKRWCVQFFYFPNNAAYHPSCSYRPAISPPSCSRKPNPPITSTGSST